MSRRRPLTLCVRTWNVGATPPPSGGLESWIMPSETGDVYAIGLQEVVDINTPITYLRPSLLWPNSGLPLEDLPGEAASWQRAIAHLLPGYSLVAHNVLVGMLLFVFVRDEHEPFCSARVAALGTGPLGAGNKGAVAASIRLYGSTLCIVSSHLAAGATGVRARNSEVASLQEQLTFTDPSEAISPNGLPLPPRSIGDHEFVVWFGDLNYRISLPDVEVRELLEVGDCDALARLAVHDELLAERTAGRVFNGFVEDSLAFLPTYKYDMGCDVYDTSRKRRAPAWTDRVVWRGSEHVRCLNYSRVDALRTSDHRPVVASLELSVVTHSTLTGRSFPDASILPSSMANDASECLIQGLKSCLAHCWPGFGAGSQGYQRL